MKIILLVGCSIIIGLGSLIYFTGPVDLVGSYAKENNNPRIIINALHLNADNSFIYQYGFIEGIAESRFVRGEYEIIGKKLKLFAQEFETVSHLPLVEDRPIVVRERPGNGAISAMVRPEQFKKLLTRFEAGSSQLKPVYFFKRVNENLSLCLKNVRTGRLTAEFIRSEE